MSKSKMKEVAKLLGVELGEEFKIKDIYNTYKFTNDGLYDCYSNDRERMLYNLLTGKYEIEKHILDKVEKEYLENFLRPFKNKVELIEKRESRNKQYVCICINGQYIYLPYFEKNTMYKGMELNKEYTLKELGLFE